MIKTNQQPVPSDDFFVNNSIVDALSTALIILSGLLAFVAVTTV